MIELKKVTHGVFVINNLATLTGGLALPYKGYGVCQLRWDALTVGGSHGQARPLDGWVGRTVGRLAQARMRRRRGDINKPTGRHRRMDVQLCVVLSLYPSFRCSPDQTCCLVSIIILQRKRMINSVRYKQTGQQTLTAGVYQRRSLLLIGRRSKGQRRTNARSMTLGLRHQSEALENYNRSPNLHNSIDRCFHHQHDHQVLYIQRRCRRCRHQLMHNLNHIVLLPA